MSSRRRELIETTQSETRFMGRDAEEIISQLSRRRKNDLIHNTAFVFGSVKAFPELYVFGAYKGFVMKDGVMISGDRDLSVEQMAERLLRRSPNVQTLPSQLGDCARLIMLTGAVMIDSSFETGRMYMTVTFGNIPPTDAQIQSIDRNIGTYFVRGGTGEYLCSNVYYKERNAYKYRPCGLSSGEINNLPRDKVVQHLVYFAFKDR